MESSENLWEMSPLEVKRLLDYNQTKIKNPNTRFDLEKNIQSWITKHQIQVVKNKWYYKKNFLFLLFSSTPGELLGKWRMTERKSKRANLKTGLVRHPCKLWTRGKLQPLTTQNCWIRRPLPRTSARLCPSLLHFLSLLFPPSTLFSNETRTPGYFAVE